MCEGKTKRANDLYFLMIFFFISVFIIQAFNLTSNKSSFGEKSLISIQNSGVNFAYSNFQPESFANDDINCSIFLTANNSLQNDTEQFMYKMGSGESSPWISTHSDNFSDNIISSFWTKFNEMNGQFIENSSGLVLKDIGDHEWSMKNENAPLLSQVVWKYFQLKGHLNFSGLKSSHPAAGMLLKWGDGFLKLAVSLNALNSSLELKIYFISNGSSSLIDDVPLGTSKVRWMRLTRSGFFFLLEDSLDDINYNVILNVSLNVPDLVDLGIFAEHGGEVSTRTWVISPSIDFTPVNSTSGHVNVSGLKLDFRYPEGNAIKFSMRDNESNQLVSDFIDLVLDASSGNINFSSTIPNKTSARFVDVASIINISSINDINQDSASFAFSRDGSKPVEFTSPHSDFFDGSKLRDFWHILNQDRSNISFTGNALVFKDVNQTNHLSITTLPFLYQESRGTTQAIVKVNITAREDGEMLGLMLKDGNDYIIFWLKILNSGTLQFSAQSWKNLTLSTNDTSLPVNIVQNYTWLKIWIDGGQVKCSYSFNGDTYAQYDDMFSLESIMIDLFDVGIVVAENSSGIIDYWDMSPSLVVKYDLAIDDWIIRVKSFTIQPTAINLIRFKIADSSNITSESRVFFIEYQEYLANNMKFLISDGNVISVIYWNGSIEWSVQQSKVLDKELLDDGQLLVTKGGIGTGEILKINEMGDVTWSITRIGGQDLNFPHDADLLPNGHVLIADTLNDRVVEISDNGTIFWSWKLKDHLNYPPFNETVAYINDVDRLGDGNTLISLRNFDMIIEVNETGDIVWSYGEPGNTSILNKPHNPDREENGNTIICDSENHGIIEIDQDKNIIWKYYPKTGGEYLLGWPRDADPVGDKYILISDTRVNDTGKNAIYLVDKERETISWEHDTISANYDSDIILDKPPEIKIASPMNVTYKLSREVEVSVLKDSFLRSVYYNIRDLQNHSWIFTEPRLLDENTSIVLEDEREYMLKAWANASTGGSGWPQDDSILIDDLDDSIIYFSVNLSGNIDSNDYYEGTTMLSLMTPPKIIEITRNNDVIWEYDYSIPKGLDIKEVIMGDFERLPDDHVIYCVNIFLNNDSVISRLEEIDRKGKLYWQHDIVTGKTIGGDVHDIDYLPDLDQILVANTGNDSVIQIDRQGHVTWSWWAGDYFNKSGSPVDWMHLNQAQRLMNGNTIISLRNNNSIVEVNPSGQIVWSVGLDPNGTTLNKQHHPIRLPDGKTVLCDSENNRVIEVDKHGNITWNSDDYPSLGLVWPRSLAVLPNENMIIALPQQGRVIEINRTGNILWSLNNTCIYTAERIDKFPPIPEFDSPNDGFYNDTVWINITFHERDFNTSWYDLVDVIKNQTLFNDVPYISPVSHELPWGVYQLRTWTNDSGIINRYQGNQFKPNIGGPFIKNFTVAPIITEIKLISTQGLIKVSWRGVNWVDHYKILYSSSFITDVENATVLKDNVHETSVQARMPANGTYFFAVVAVNSTTESPLSNIVELGVVKNNMLVLTTVLIITALSVPALVGISTWLHKKKKYLRFSKMK
ncbi:MAG: aryl-sulfate sulfotransferase [Promethearchaeota archaeon]